MFRNIIWNKLISLLLVVIRYRVGISNTHDTLVEVENLLNANDSLISNLNTSTGTNLSFINQKADQTLLNTTNSNVSTNTSDITNLQDATQEMSFVLTSGTKTKFSGNVKVTGNMEVNGNINDINSTYYDPTSSIQTQFNSHQFEIDNLAVGITAETNNRTTQSSNDNNHTRLTLLHYHQAVPFEAW